MENCNLAINAAKDVGCRVTNIGPRDIMTARPHLVLGLLWQAIRLLLTQKISLKEHPGLVALLEGDETLQQLLALPPERILVRWLNYHLARAGSARRVAGFGRDLMDSEVYAVVMQQLYGAEVQPVDLTTPDLEARAARVLANAAAVGCPARSPNNRSHRPLQKTTTKSCELSPSPSRGGDTLARHRQKTTTMSQHSMDDVVRNYARDVLGMQREDLNEFLWIADEAMRAPLPDGWEQHEDESRGKPYYVNEDTGETQWTHPSDDFYREKFPRLRRQRRHHQLAVPARLTSLAARHMIIGARRGWRRLAPRRP